MRTRSRYALWSLPIVVPAFLLLVVLGTVLADLRAPIGPETGLLASFAAIFTLVVTALVAPVIALPDGRSFSKWAIVVAACILEALACVLAWTVGTPSSVVTGAYLPAALVCANLFALILIHAWVASVGMGFSPAVGLAIGVPFGAWILRLGMSQSLDRFMIASGAATVAAFAVACAAALGPSPQIPRARTRFRSDAP